MKASVKPKKQATKMAPLEVNYRLSELPSSQHRAGLAGLVLMIRWLDEHPEKKRGTLKVVNLEATSARILIDADGVAALFDEVYAATTGETAVKTPYKNSKTKEVKPPLRVEEREVKDKKGKSKVQKTYIYPVVIPRGAFQPAWDPSTTDGVNGLWVKLWRDAIWSIFRGVPATRKPYQDRAEKLKTKDAKDAWKDLLKGGAGVELPSTYFLGAQAQTAESVSFRDRASNRFLLHFWHFAAAINVPTAVDNDGKSSFHGHAFIVPDICDLEEYVQTYPQVLRDRDAEAAAYLPRAAIIDLPAEGGLEMLRVLRARLAQREGARDTADLVQGMDVFHAAKEGNNVRILGVTRVEPEEKMIDAYTQFKGAYKSPVFRRHRLLNLLQGQAWWTGFGALCATTTSKLTFENRQFRHDARQALTKTEMTMTDAQSTHTGQTKTIEEVVYGMVRAYLRRKLASKYELTWDEAKKTDESKDVYSKKREKLAREAFLAVRSRTGADFVEYFTATICSVPQRMNEEAYLAVSKALVQECERIRTLSLLALSANA